MTSSCSDDVLFSKKSAVGIGELERYIITYDLYEGNEIPEDVKLDSLWLKVKNMERLSFRAAYLVGPFMLYCDVRTEGYHHSQKIIASADQPKFESTLQAQQKCVTELSLHNIQPRYVWIVDIVSQIIFTTNTKISFEISIGSTQKSIQAEAACIAETSKSDRLTVTRLTTLDVWNLPAQVNLHQKVKHLVILTHGLHSNVSTDMAYMMEQIYKKQDKYPNEQIVVKGYTGNVCQTEKGVKYLGTQLANYIIDELYDESVIKVSFIAHSLGGLVQSFAIAYIAVRYPWFFEKVQPVNYIGIASPFLGIVTDNPAYINLLLSFGVIGKTGQDLGLEKDSESNGALLNLLPEEPLKGILKRFRRRTLYMNAINDGIVPLYTASLLFLDYDDILEELEKLKENGLRIDSANIDMVDQTDFLSRNVISPFVKILNVLAPQKFPASNPNLPRVSFLESMVLTLIPPLPAKSYLLDPASRGTVIIHDKVYTEKDLPPVTEDSEDAFVGSHNVLLNQFMMDRGRPKCQKLEERIARKWHEGISWRKVVVALKADAHNNIIVRRRFPNAYGWPVVDNLVDSHFDGRDDEIGLNMSCEISDEVSAGAQPASGISSDADDEETEPNKNFAWITRVDNPSLFDEGPTGMISTVGEMLGSFAKSRISRAMSGESEACLPNEAMITYESLDGNTI